jgi:ABC-type multidrug transport system ATPase subunit
MRGLAAQSLEIKAHSDCGMHLYPMDEARPAILSKVVARELTKLFGATPALRGASLEIHGGEVVLLSGENGAGKSTLLGLIGTQLKPTRGQLAYLDADSRPLSRQAVRAQLGWVSHTSHCYGELTGRQNVELVADLQGVDRGLYQVVKERLGLGQYAERPVRTLSRGQMQRVALARALIHSPRLLLLDEPWTGLDQKSSQLLEVIVREERERGCLIVVVSHELGLAARLDAREIRLQRGQVQNGR